MRYYLCLASLIFLILSAPLRAQESSTPSLSVRGEAVVNVPADQVKFRVAVETTGKDAEQALEQNNRLMESVLKALKKAGLGNGEYETGSFSVMPQWSPRPRQAANDWKSRIVGYQVRNQLQIETTKLEKVGDWIAAATASGANSVGQLVFSLQDPDKYRNEAIQLATRKARGYAEAAADAADMVILSLSAIQVDGANIVPLVRGRAMRAERMMMAVADAPSAPSLSGGDIEVRANVSVSYWLTER